MFNSNVTEEHNVVGVPIKRAARKDTKLVVIDPREVELTRYADVWLRPVPGTELLLLGGVLRSVIDQGLENTGWLEERCESPATLYYALRNLDMDEVSRVTHVSLEQIPRRLGFTVKRTRERLFTPWTTSRRPYKRTASGR